MSDTGWTPARVETLTSLWKEGLSAAQVAKSLGGVSRNAVIGKVHRLGLAGRAPGGGTMTVRARTPRPAPQRPARPAAVRPARLNRPPAVDEGPGLAPRLEMLGPRCCHWPLGDPKAAGFSFCGRPSSSGPYCPAHDGQAHRPGKARPLSADPTVRRVLAGLAA